MTANTRQEAAWVKFCEDQDIDPDKELSIVEWRYWNAGWEARAALEEPGEDKLRRAVRSLLNGIDTGAVMIDSYADETLANTMRAIREAMEAGEGAKSDTPAVNCDQGPWADLCNALLALSHRHRAPYEARPAFSQCLQELLSRATYLRDSFEKDQGLGPATELIDGADPNGWRDHLEALRRVNTRAVMTVWVDSPEGQAGYKVWGDTDAKYAEKDPGFLMNIDLGGAIARAVDQGLGPNKDGAGE